MPRVGIVDYGMGNLRSVEKSLQRAGVEAEQLTDADKIQSFEGLILPGVGAFGDAMRNLRDLQMIESLRGFIDSGRPLLGICLGLQLLFDYSEEHGRFEGLGVIPGRVIRLPEGVKVPHMGWNVVEVKKEVPLFENIERGSRFYFVHSFYCDPADSDWTIATTQYGLDFTCAAGKDNVLGVQFHPEKSSSLGLSVLANFGKMVSGTQ